MKKNDPMFNSVLTEPQAEMLLRALNLNLSDPATANPEANLVELSHARRHPRRSYFKFDRNSFDLIYEHRKAGY